MRKFGTLLVLMLTISLSGCTSWWLGGADPVRRGSSSSLVDFLYPDGSKPEPPSEQLPYLELPLKVGITFVPGNTQDALPPSEQQLLLTRVADAFRDRPYVTSIQVIPSSYLRSTRGMQGMKQVAGMFGVDVMALVSYDQLGLTGERDSAILYWTVVGALVVKGNVNEVQTMIDTAVFDVNSTKLLFRAPGTHRNSRNATFMDADREMRNLQLQSYSQATDDMILNLNHELEQFRDRVKRGESASVAWKPGSGGGGSTSPLLPMMLMVLCAMRRPKGYAKR